MYNLFLSLDMFEELEHPLYVLQKHVYNYFTVLYILTEKMILIVKMGVKAMIREKNLPYFSANQNAWIRRLFLTQQHPEKASLLVHFVKNFQFF